MLLLRGGPLPFLRAAAASLLIKKISGAAGAQQVVGLEYQPCPALDAFLPAGTKVVVHSPRVRRGVLLLTPANLVVLGGGVERLEQASARLAKGMLSCSGLTGLAHPV